MSGYNSDLNAGYGEHSGVNWAAVAGYGAAGSIGLGMMRAGGRAMGTRWRDENGKHKLQNLTGLRGRGMTPKGTFQKPGMRAMAKRGMGAPSSKKLRKRAMKAGKDATPAQQRYLERRQARKGMEGVGVQLEGKKGKPRATTQGDMERFYKQYRGGMNKKQRKKRGLQSKTWLGAKGTAKGGGISPEGHVHMAKMQAKGKAPVLDATTTRPGGQYENQLFGGNVGPAPTHQRQIGADGKPEMGTRPIPADPALRQPSGHAAHTPFTQKQLGKAERREGKAMAKLKEQAAMKRMKTGKDMTSGALRQAGGAVGWLGAFDQAGKGWGRAGAVATRAGMVGLGMKAGGAGLDWLFD